MLIVTRLDETTGWGYNHSIDICFNYKTSFYFFQEDMPQHNDFTTARIKFNNKKILDSRDPEYFNNNKAW